MSEQTSNPAARATRQLLPPVKARAGILLIIRSTCSKPEAHQTLKLLGSLRIHKTGKPSMFGGPFSIAFKAGETQESRIVRLLLAMMVKMVKRL